jgi:Domain of Unknown Function (DUF326)
MSDYEHRTCIEACVQCAQECERCGAACLKENDAAGLMECIRLDRDCAQLCWAAAAFMSRSSPFADGLCRLGADICDACAVECAKHEHDHCQQCARACRTCAEECRAAASVPEWKMAPTPMW